MSKKPLELPAAVLGIDPGYSGGLAVVTYDGKVPFLAPMPATTGKPREIDVPALVRFIDAASARCRLVGFVIELVGPMPTDGAVSAFQFGAGFGELRGVLKFWGLASGVPLEQVPPKTWQGALFPGVAKAKVKKGERKPPKPSIAYVQRRFPGVSLLASPKCTTPHDGLSDAICIAEYGCRLFRS